VKAILVALAKELEGWDLSGLDRRTATAFGEVLKGGDLEDDESIKALLQRVQPIIADLKSTKSDGGARANTRSKQAGSSNSRGNNQRGGNPRRVSEPGQNKTVKSATVSTSTVAAAAAAAAGSSTTVSDPAGTGADAVSGRGELKKIRVSSSDGLKDPVSSTAGASWSLGNIIR
jgi:hypothetical protein